MIRSMSKDELIQTFSEVMDDGIGTINDPPVSIKLKKDVKPGFLKARTVPFALKKVTDLDLERLINEGILKPVDISDWACPVVIFPKRNGTVAIIEQLLMLVLKMINIHFREWKNYFLN